MLLHDVRCKQVRPVKPAKKTHTYTHTSHINPTVHTPPQVKDANHAVFCAGSNVHAAVVKAQCRQLLQWGQQNSVLGVLRQLMTQGMERGLDQLLLYGHA